MCGRFTLKTPVEEVAALFGVADPGDLELPARYNIAPTQPVLAVRLASNGAEPGRELALLRWGLVPGWVEDPEDWPTLINARAESLHRKPAFEDAVRFRRCVVPADGFYEWRREGGGKQPYYVRSEEDVPLCFAGLWERWSGGPDDPVESCTIVTTDANELLKPLHPRMPAILTPEGRERWLDPALRHHRELVPLLRPAPSAGLRVYPVTRRVNRPDFDGPDCIAPLEGEEGVRSTVGEEGVRSTGRETEQADGESDGRSTEGEATAAEPGEMPAARDHRPDQLPLF